MRERGWRADVVESGYVGSADFASRDEASGDFTPLSAASDATLGGARQPSWPSNEQYRFVQSGFAVRAHQVP
jgi:hypothetical protein